MSQSFFERNESQFKWREIRTKYCVLKLLIGGAKSEKEILELLGTMQEFLERHNINLTQAESAIILTKVIKELANEGKIKRRDIFNTRTKESKTEWFANPDWLSQTRILKSEIKRIRKLEEQERQLKAELERRKVEREEREKREQAEKLKIERTAKLTTGNSILDQKKSTTTKPKPKTSSSADKESSNSQIITGILSIVAVGGGIYVISEIGNALNKAFTFPVFLITCLTAYSIYHITKRK